MTEDAIVVKKWMVSIIITLASAIVTGLIWAVRMDERMIDIHEDIAQLRAVVETRTEDRWHRAEAMREWEFHRSREHQGLTPHNHTDDNWRVSP